MSWLPKSLRCLFEFHDWKYSGYLRVCRRCGRTQSLYVNSFGFSYWEDV